MIRARSRKVRSIKNKHVPPIAQLPALPPLDISINVDLPCIRCAYNLKSKLVGDRCSECGTVVLATFDKLRLAYEREQIIINTRCGIHLISYGGIIIGVFLLIGMCLDVLLVQSLFKTVLSATIVSLMIVGLISHFVGAWRLAAPYLYYKIYEATLRRLIRLNTIMLCTAILLGIFHLLFKLIPVWASISLQAVVILGCSIHGVVLSSLLLEIERRCVYTSVKRMSRWKVFRFLLIVATASYVTVFIGNIAEVKWDSSKPNTVSAQNAIVGLTIIGVVILAVIARRTCRMVDIEWKVCKLLSAKTSGTRTLSTTIDK